MSGLSDNQDIQSLRLQFHTEARAEIQKRQQSNSENYDRAILSLSTALLGLSLAFLKDLVPIDHAHDLILLYLSWGALGLAVVGTVVSFQISQRALIDALVKIDAYYLCNDASALSRSKLAVATDWLNWSSGGLFIAGLGLTIAFVIINS